MVMCAGGASAITTDGDWSDWFSYGGTVWNDWDQAAASGSRLNSEFRFANDPDNDAYGGQPYDIEQIFYYYEDAAVGFTGGVLHVGMVTGYDPANTAFRSGDMFFDLGAEGSFDVAVATGTENARFGSAWINTGWSTSATDFFPSSDPYRVVEGSGGVIEYGTGLASGLSATVAWGLGVGAGSAHNFLEIAIDLDGTQEELVNNGLGAGGLGLHWTMECGNDEIDVIDDVPLVPVPEPTTMVLLGMGVLGMALRARRPVC
jgi:hypothetical protein